MESLRNAIINNPSFCDKFLHNPSINPVTGRKIIIGKQTYNYLVRICGNPKNIINNIQNIAFTGNPDVDKQILLNLDNITLNNVEVNKYIYNLLTDNQFWRIRLEQNFQLISTEPNLRYKFIVKYLSNGKSLEGNFNLAIKDNLPEIFTLVFNNIIFNQKSYDYAFGTALHYNNLDAYKMLIDKIKLTYAITHGIFRAGQVPFINILVQKMNYKDILAELLTQCTYKKHDTELINKILNPLKERHDIDPKTVKNMLISCQHKQYSELYRLIVDEYNNY